MPSREFPVKTPGAGDAASTATYYHGLASEGLVVTRAVDAARELIWRAYAEPDRLMKWWGPKGFEMLVAKVDFRPGGVFHYALQSPEGMEMWGRIVYREIVSPEKLEMLVSFSNKSGDIVRSPMNSTWPLEMLSSMSLEENEGKSTLTIRAMPINATPEEKKSFEEGREGMKEGINGSLDQLETYLASLKE